MEYFDEVERTTEAKNPIAYAFEPIRQNILRSILMDSDDSGDERVPEPDSWRIGNNVWCKCGACIPMPTSAESMCCQEVNLGHIIQDRCVMTNPTFQMLCKEREVLEVSMLSLRDVRVETLVRPINSRLTAYRQFTLWSRGHLGRRHRIPIPSCVVNAIRNVFPSKEYHGFEYFYDL